MILLSMSLRDLMSNLHIKITDCFSKLLNKPIAKTKIKFKFIHVGKFLMNSTTPRPIKLILSDPDSAKIILQTCIRSKIHKELLVPLQHLIIARDRTPAQRQEYLALKEEMKRRTSVGEKNLRIVTRGIRQIIVQNDRNSVLGLNKDH